MNLFLGKPLVDGNASLTEEDSGHCIRVLRMKAGDDIFFTDGEGNLYSGKIIDPDPRACLLQITDTKPAYGKRNYSVHMAVAPTKNIERFEWFLEKATEIGVDEITPVFCEHSERKIIKTERLKKIVTAAMKQSVRTYLPRLHEAIPLNQFIKSGLPHPKFICQMSAHAQLKNKLVPGSDCVIIIGPEGDFSERESIAAHENGFIPAGLGNNRLRTETAGIVACTIVSLLNQ